MKPTRMNPLFCPICRTVIALLLLAVPAFANQPPGPGVALPQLLMLPAILVFTALGGGYVILRKQKPGKAARAALWGGTALLFFLGLIHEGLSMFVTIIFAGMAIVRGLRLIRWGAQPATQVEASEPRPAGMRLKIAGVCLIVVAIFLAGSAVAFVGYWPGIRQGMQVTQLRKFLASEIAYGRMQKQQTGELRFYPIKSDDTSHWAARDFAKNKNVGIQFSPDGKHFTVYVLPVEKFPPWPYRWFTTQGSYRADDSGQIRMIAVRRQDQICPPDAPVVMTVNEQDVHDVSAEEKPSH